MRTRGNKALGLDRERSIWIEQEDLGKEKAIRLKGKRYAVKIPTTMNKGTVLRLRGLGRTKGDQAGDLLLHVWLNKGDDIRRDLWLSETSAKNGGEKTLPLGGKKITMVIPPNSHDGMTVRLRGLGEELHFNWRAPFLRRKRGNLLVRLAVYPDSITPRYRSFDALGTDDMALEGWVYRKIDEVIELMGRSSFPVNAIPANEIADLFNERGWQSIFYALRGQLRMNRPNITLTKSNSIPMPGRCQRTVTFRDNAPIANSYKIEIHDRFVLDPFAVAAILGHELCHVVYSERIDPRPISVGHGTSTERVSLEEERTVDLLVFMFKIGEFQLRVARDKRLTLGYFNQEVFERIQVIVSRKLNLT